MCDFKPGDEVIYVGPIKPTAMTIQSGLEVGSIHTVISVETHALFGYVGIRIAARPLPVMAYSFRKVQRRDLGAWLSTAATEGETRHLDKKTKERV